jgi:hypothetical protein
MVMDLDCGQRPSTAGRAIRDRIIAAPAYLAPATVVSEQIRWLGACEGAAPVAMR